MFLLLQLFRISPVGRREASESLRAQEELLVANGCMSSDISHCRLNVDLLSSRPNASFPFESPAGFSIVSLRKHSSPSPKKTWTVSGAHCRGMYRARCWGCPVSLPAWSTQIEKLNSS